MFRLSQIDVHFVHYVARFKIVHFICRLFLSGKFACCDLMKKSGHFVPGNWKNVFVCCDLTRKSGHLFFGKLKQFFVYWDLTRKSGHFFCGKLKRFLFIGIWRENLAIFCEKLKEFFFYVAIWRENLGIFAREIERIFECWDLTRKTGRKDSLELITQPWQIRHCLRKFAAGTCEIAI